MRRNNITVCETYYSNEFSGFTYVVNYSFGNFKTFGFISMSSTGYVSPLNQTVQPQVAPNIITTYRIITGQSYWFIPETELRKRINLQEYNDVVIYLRTNSKNVVETSNVSFDRLVNVLVTNIRQERSVAENEVRNAGNNAIYRRVRNSYGEVTEWIVYQAVRR